MWLRKGLGILAIWILLTAFAGSADFRTHETARLSSIARAQVDAEDPSPIYFPLIFDKFSGENPPDFNDSLFGIELNPVKDLPVLQQSSGLVLSYTRVNGLRWAEIEPVEGERNWSAAASVEEQMKTAALNDVRVILVIRNTPGWAQKVPGSACGPIKEDKLEAFANFVYDIVSRYRGAPYYIKHWEIYNEPDVAPEISPNPNGLIGCWGDSADEYYGGGYYATMLKSIYPKIKQADPEAQVVVGGLLMSYNPASGVAATEHQILASKFFEGILANGGGDYFDGVGFHNYERYLGKLGTYWRREWSSSWDTTGPALIAKANFLRNLMEAYGVSGKFLMNTETALLCGNAKDPPGGPGCESDPQSDYEQTKAYYLIHSYAAALAEGLQANIWYNLYGWCNSGLIYADQSPRPAYHSFQFVRQKLEDVNFIGSITSDHTGGTSSVLGYRFQQTDGRQIWVIWAKYQMGSTISLPEPPISVWDAFGDPVSVPNAVSLTVTYKPLFIELAP